MGFISLPPITSADKRLLKKSWGRSGEVLPSESPWPVLTIRKWEDHLLNQYFLSVFCVLGIPLRLRDTAENKNIKILAFQAAETDDKENMWSVI